MNKENIKALIWIELSDKQQTEVSNKAGPGQWMEFFQAVPLVTKNQRLLNLAEEGRHYCK